MAGVVNSVSINQFSYLSSNLIYSLRIDKVTFSVKGLVFSLFPASFGSSLFSYTASYLDTRFKITDLFQPSNLKATASAYTSKTAMPKSTSTPNFDQVRFPDE